MRTLRLMLTMFLSLAILSVGSAAAAMSVNSPCAMMQSSTDDMAMANMDMSAGSMQDMQGMADMQSMAHMDCMHVDKSHSGQDGLCKSGSHCLMYSVQLAYSVSGPSAMPSTSQYYVAQQVLLQPQQFLPKPDLFGLWRPPRAL